MQPRRFVLLDRDGTINIDRHYLADPAGLELLPYSLAGLKHLSRLGLGLAVVSNQSGIGRGYFTEEALDAIHLQLRRLLADGGVTLDGIYFCPHVAADDCGCRKPRPGLVRQAAAAHGFDPAAAFVIGDKACDIDLGRAVGATTLLVGTGVGSQASAEIRQRADHVVANLAEAAVVIAMLLDSVA